MNELLQHSLESMTLKELFENRVILQFHEKMEYKKRRKLELHVHMQHFSIYKTGKLVFHFSNLY
jgi:hypothetical protein